MTVSPGSARISATLSPGRSGRTAVSSRGMTMPDTSTMAEKQDFVAFSTVTAAPFGPSLGTSGSSAAREGSEAKLSRPATAGASHFRESARAAKLFINNPVRFSGVTDSRRLALAPSAAPGTGCSKLGELDQFLTGRFGSAA